MDIANNLNIDGTVKATGKLGGGVQASNEGDAVLLGSDGKVPSSLQATDMTLRLDTDTKILTVTVNGASKTVDLSGLGGGMKQVIRSYTDYATFYADLKGGNIPIGANVRVCGYKSDSYYTMGYFDFITPDRPNPGMAGRRSSTSAETNAVMVTMGEDNFFGVAVSNIRNWNIIVKYWE